MTTSGAQQGIRPGVCLSTSRPASPYIGQIIYMTDVNQSAVWNGTSWEGLDRSRDRNEIINGSMQVTQRGTSVTGITTIGYNTADRWVGGSSGAGTWTNAVVADAPTGSGLTNSNKWTCTTAQASLGASAYALVYQNIEGQNLQRLSFGSASASSVTLSFWVKSNVTGTYIAELYGPGGISASYTISSSGVWEKKILTYVGNTATAIANNNSNGLGVQFMLAAGTNFTSGGSLQTSWGGATNTRFFGQVNVASAINNYWQITGVQLEAGVVATPFEFEDYETTLSKCQRYYNKSYNDAIAVPTNAQTAGLQYSPSYTAASQGHSIAHITFPVAMRANPIVTVYSYTSSTAGAVSNVQGTDLAANSGIAQFISTKSANIYNNSGGTITPNLGGYVFHYVANAEL